MSENTHPPCGLPRRLMAILYDGLLLFSILFFATVIILPFKGGAAVASHNISYNLYLVIISYIYFAWQWIHGGQTLGMRAWRIRVLNYDGEMTDWKHASLRFVFSMVSWLICAIGFLWSLIDNQKRTLHDLWSRTILIIEPKKDTLARSA